MLLKLLVGLAEVNQLLLLSLRKLQDSVLFVAVNDGEEARQTFI